MMFAEQIKRLREELQMPQRVVTSALELNTPMYSRIERGERPAKRTQISVIANVLQADNDELLALWLADQVIAVVEDEYMVADKALSIAKENIKRI